MKYHRTSLATVAVVVTEQIGYDIRLKIIRPVRIHMLKWAIFVKAFRPYAHDVISVGRPHLEVKRRLFIGQFYTPRVQICAFRLFRHRFSTKMAAGWRQCIRSIQTFGICFEMRLGWSGTMFQRDGPLKYSLVFIANFVKSCLTDKFAKIRQILLSRNHLNRKNRGTLTVMRHLVQWTKKGLLRTGVVVCDSP